MYSSESIAIGLLFFVAGVAFAALVAFLVLLFFVMRKVAASVAVLAELTQPLVKDKTLPKLVENLDRIIHTFANMTKGLAVTSNDLRAFTNAVYGGKPEATEHPRVEAEFPQQAPASSFEAMVGTVQPKRPASGKAVDSGSAFYAYNEDDAYIHQQDAELARGGIIIDEALQTPTEAQINRDEV